MSMLCTLPAHRRRGFAGLCLSGLARRLSGLGVRPYLMAEEGNPAPRELFRRLGFAPVPGHRVKFIAFRPNRAREDSD